MRCYLSGPGLWLALVLLATPALGAPVILDFEGAVTRTDGSLDFSLPLGGPPNVVDVFADIPLGSPASVLIFFDDAGFVPDAASGTESGMASVTISAGGAAFGINLDNVDAYVTYGPGTFGLELGSFVQDFHSGPTGITDVAQTFKFSEVDGEFTATISGFHPSQLLGDPPVDVKFGGTATDPGTSVVPEPAGLILMATGIVGLLGCRRRLRTCGLPGSAG